MFGPLRALPVPKGNKKRAAAAREYNEQAAAYNAVLPAYKALRAEIETRQKTLDATEAGARLIALRAARDARRDALKACATLWVLGRRRGCRRADAARHRSSNMQRPQGEWYLDFARHGAEAAYARLDVIRDVDGETVKACIAHEVAEERLADQEEDMPEPAAIRKLEYDAAAMAGIVRGMERHAAKIRPQE